MQESFSKKSEIVSIRVTPEERDRLLMIAKWEDRNVSDTLHRLLFGGRKKQGLLGQHCKRTEAA
jgi:hypothetical protein